MRAARLALAISLAAGCAGSPESPPEPEDPFSKSATFDLLDPARAATTLEPIALHPGPSPNGPRPLLALARELNDDVQIVAADGAGALFEQDPAPAGEGPRDVASLDIDGDGQLDIVVADTGGSTLTALLRTGNDGFAPPSTTTLSRAPRRLAIADIDGDGRQDLLVSVGLDPSDGGIEAWSGTGGQLTQLFAFIAVPGAAHVAAGDLDGDGDMDVGVVTSGAWVALRNDHGSLQWAVEFESPCIHPNASTIADLDGDGRGDAALACDGEILILHDPLGAGSTRSLGPAGNLYDLIAADLDLDGTIDIAAADVQDHAARIWLSPEREGAQAFVHQVARGPIALGALDLERDGDRDLWVLGYEERRLEILENHARK